MKSLHRHISPSLLPEIYGGSLPTPTFSSTEWNTLLKSFDEEFASKYTHYFSIFSKFFTYIRKHAKISLPVRLELTSPSIRGRCLNQLDGDSPISFTACLPQILLDVTSTAFQQWSVDSSKGREFF